MADTQSPATGGEQDGRVEEPTHEIFPDPGDAGDRVWGLEHDALVHRAEHNAPGVTRLGQVILQEIKAPETYVLPDPEPHWEPPYRVPLAACTYISWSDDECSEKYRDAAKAHERFSEVTS